MGMLDYLVILAGVFVLLILPQFAIAGEIQTISTFSSSMLHNAAVFGTVGMFGIVCHWAKKWMQKEIEGSLWAYLAQDYFRRTLLTLTSFVGTTATMALTDQFNGLNLQQLIMLAFTTGFAFDSAMNKGSAPKP